MKPSSRGSWGRSSESPGHDGVNEECVEQEEDCQKRAWVGSGYAGPGVWRKGLEAAATLQAGDSCGLVTNSPCGASEKMLDLQ